MTSSIDCAPTTGPRGWTAQAAAAACLAAVAALPAVAAEGESAAAQIAEALSAAPAGIQATATVSTLDGTILREGGGDYTCLPAPEGIAGPMCLDSEWRRWMQAWTSQEPFTADRLGIAYMLAGDTAEGGASNIDPTATEPTAGNDWVVEGPHVMLIVPDPATLDGLPVTLDTGGPYVMWAGTPYAHVMVPVDERPDQRPVLTD